MAEIKNLDAVAALDAMDAHVDDWRDAVKGKQRGIFSFDDVAALKIKNLKNRLVLHKNRVERYTKVCYHSFRLINYVLG